VNEWLIYAALLAQQTYTCNVIKVALSETVSKTSWFDGNAGWKPNGKKIL